MRQMRRWCLGLWQTIRRHPPRRPVFGMALAAMVIELVTSSLAFVALPVVVLLLLLAALVPDVAAVPALGDATTFLTGEFSLTLLLLVVFVSDYVLTIAVAIAERRPRYLLDGLFFVPMRVTDAAIALAALPKAWSTRSTGRWVSPTRRAVDAGPVPTSERKVRA